MNAEDILDRLPFELAARLESDPFFTDIPIVVAVKGNVAAELQRKEAITKEKNGKWGICVIVLQVVGNDPYPGLPGGPLDLRPAFQVIENVELNSDEESGTGKSARKVARHIISNLKISGFRGIVQGLTCDTPAIEPVDLTEVGKSVVCEQVNFKCQEFSDEKFLYCLPPVAADIGIDGQGNRLFSLATNTPGAEIWYTTDDSFPYPGTKDDGFADSTSQKYTDPIPVASGQTITIRAIAHQNNYIDSSIERFDIINPN